MRTNLARLIVAVLTLGSVSAMQTPASAPEGQWLIERVGGAWDVREDPRKRVHRQVVEKYDVLTAGSQVRCTKLPCVLDYSTDGVAARPLFAKAPPLNSWVIVPKPKEQPVAPAAREMLGTIGRAGVRGGANKAPGICGGELTLLAPTCQEVVDPATFRLIWQVRPSEAGKDLLIQVWAADATERRRFYVAADAEQLQRPDLNNYLRDLQQNDRPTDVMVRLMRTENVDVSRMVKVLSYADQLAFNARVASYQRLAELPRQLKTIEAALKLQMWTRAADLALELERGNPASLEIRKYALVGVCASDYAHEIARLKSALNDVGVKGICDSKENRP
jgi:hypothetical protein